jgi:hypothetical protein
MIQDARSHEIKIHRDIVNFYKKSDLTPDEAQVFLFLWAFFLFNKQPKTQFRVIISYPSEEAIVDLSSDKDTLTKWTAEQFERKKLKQCTFFFILSFKTAELSAGIKVRKVH